MYKESELELDLKFEKLVQLLVEFGMESQYQIEDLITIAKGAIKAKDTTMEAESLAQWLMTENNINLAYQLGLTAVSSQPFTPMFEAANNELQVLEEKQGALDLESLFVDIQSLSQHLVVTGNIFAREDDIHKHTPTLGKYYRQNFQPLDHKYQLSNAGLDLDTVIQEILQKTDSSQLANVTKVLQSIRGSGKTEPETGANLKTLLITTWSLANHPLAASNSKELVVDNLNHNVVTGGGCLAGIAGRLIQPYSALLLWCLENQFKTQQDRMVRVKL